MSDRTGLTACARGWRGRCAHVCHQPARGVVKRDAAAAEVLCPLGASRHLRRGQLLHRRRQFQLQVSGCAERYPDQVILHVRSGKLTNRPSGAASSAHRRVKLPVPAMHVADTTLRRRTSAATTACRFLPVPERTSTFGERCSLGGMPPDIALVTPTDAAIAITAAVVATSNYYADLALQIGCGNSEGPYCRVGGSDSVRHSRCFGRGGALVAVPARPLEEGDQVVWFRCVSTADEVLLPAAPNPLPPVRREGRTAARDKGIICSLWRAAVVDEGTLADNIK